MLSVTFNQPILIDAANLHSLLSLANAPAVVEPYLNGKVVAEQRPGRQPRLTNEKGEKAGDKEPKAKRTRATKAEMLERKAAAAEAASETPANPVLEPEPAPEEAPAAETTAEPEAAAVASAPKALPRKRDRRSPAKKAADEAAAKAPIKVAAAKKQSNGTGKTTTPVKEDAPDPAVMLERFAKLIDSDFDNAKATLDEFGVNRFSDLKPDQHAAFGAKLTELGV